MKRPVQKVAPETATDRRTERSSDAVAIDRIEQAPAHQLVIDQIRRAIQLGRFLPGDKLPAERDLAGLLGVSRATVRDAIKVLDSDGTVSIRRGAHGGLVVNRHHAMDTRTLRARLQRQARELDDIFDYRIAIECKSARLAAERRTDKHLAMLETALSRMAELAASPRIEHGAHTTALFNAADTEFHLGVAVASGNEYLIAGAETVRRAMFLPVGAVFSELHEDANDMHASIFRAIADSDGDAAEGFMLRHVEATRSVLAALLKPQAVK